MPFFSSFDTSKPHAADVLLYGDIGTSWWDDSSVDAVGFVQQLAALSSNDALTVRINSYGGSVSDGLAIYNAIRRHAGETETIVDGVAISIASLIAMAGTKRKMCSNALLMIHAPWNSLAGNAGDMRQNADVLDKHAQAMATAYAAATGKPIADALAWLTDYVDHWFTAEEALAEGLITEIIDANPAQARFDLSRYRLPAAAMAFHAKPIIGAKTMPKIVKPTAGDDEQLPTDSTPAVPDESETDELPPAAAAQKVVRAALAADRVRRGEIRGAFAPFAHSEKIAAIRDACIEDEAVTVAQAREKLLAALGSETQSIAGASRVYTPRGGDETEKLREAATAVLLKKAGIKAAAATVESGNPFRSYRLMDFARAALDRAGISQSGMSQLEVVAAAFTQSTSDFPILLENTMNKALLAGWEIAPFTYSRWARVGSVNDFRASGRYRVGSFGNLDSLSESGEFKNKPLTDGEKASITATTKGNLVHLSRQAIINDDLGAFVGLANSLGIAARRTVETDGFALLASNPTMPQDSVALFHATHGNLAASGGAVSIATVNAAAIALGKQKGVGANDYLDLVPSVFLGGLGAASDAKVVNKAEYDMDSTKAYPNRVQGLFSDIVGSPRISGNEWYLLADPLIAPAFEVAFLDGQEEPFLEMQDQFGVDGTSWKIRIDYGWAPLEWRSIYKNPGA